MMNLTFSLPGYIMDNEALEIFIRKVDRLIQAHTQLQQQLRASKQQQTLAAEEIRQLIHRLKLLEDQV